MAPGKIQLRISVEGTASQVLDSETREISVPDLTGAQALLGTPAVLRARTAREFQQLRTDADAVPIAGREFNRIEHLLVRVPTYGPAGTTPELRVHLLNRAGAAMNELKAEPAPKAGEQQIDLPLAALPPGRIRPRDQGRRRGRRRQRTGRLPRHRLTGHASASSRHSSSPRWPTRRAIVPSTIAIRNPKAASSPSTSRSPTRAAARSSI